MGKLYYLHKFIIKMIIIWWLFCIIKIKEIFSKLGIIKYLSNLWTRLIDRMQKLILLYTLYKEMVS